MQEKRQSIMLNDLDWQCTLANIANETCVLTFVVVLVHCDSGGLKESHFKFLMQSE